MGVEFRLATVEDIDRIEKFYDMVTDHQESGVNYNGWKKGIYPARQDAEKGVKEKTLYLALEEKTIVGSIILNSEKYDAYDTANWQCDAEYKDIMVIHTYMVNPNYLKMGIGSKLLSFAEQLARESKKKAIRLDVSEGNIPGIKIYEKHGYKRVAKVDLGLGIYGLDWFYLYEKLV